MGRLYDAFLSAGSEVLVILGEPVQRARQYAQILHLPFAVLADPERRVYHQYGLEKAMIFIQRTASLVIDPSGIIQYWKSTTNPMTWLAESLNLLRAVQEKTGQD